MSNWERVAETPQRLKEALTKANMKQADLVRATGIDKGSIHHYLTGKYEPKADPINKMAIALNVNEMWLWGYDVPMEREKKTPDKIELTEGEEMLLDLFRRVPVESQQMVLDMIKIALKQNQ
jgi:transcriptional regulator with XRE-family HTH domain